GARSRASTGVPPSVNSMMSSFSMRSGARARESRKRFGLSGWRALTCPNESTTPSCARMRLAVTISSSSTSRLGMGTVPSVSYHLGVVPAKAGTQYSRALLVMMVAPVPSAFTGSPLSRERQKGHHSQNKTHRAERAQFMRIDQHAALLDPERVARTPQHIAILADIFAHALVAAKAIADEVRRHRDQLALNAKNPHIGDHPPGARLRKLGMAVRIIDTDHALANALAVIRHQKQRVAMTAVGLIVGRHVIGGVVRQEALPLVELPFVEQRSLVIEKILDLLPRDHGAGRDRHAGAPISSFQRRQKMRR